MSDPLNPTPVEPTPEVPAAAAAETPVEPIVPVEPVAPAAAPTYPAAPAAPTYPAAPAAPAVAVPPTNGFATAALTLGIIALALAVLGFIPFVGVFFFDWVAIPAGIAAIILGVVGMNRGKLNGVGYSKARTGLILGIIGLVLDIIAIVVGFIIIAAIFANAGGVLDKATEVAQACSSQESGAVVTLSDGSTFTCP